MTKTETHTQWLSLEREGLLLLLALPVVMGAGLWLDVTVHRFVGFIPFLAWLVWFTAWASKGGIPPRF